jgi:5-methylcytosine-specific restriction enzyme subunit McrC
VSTAIPIQNLYYLLSYAWEDKLDPSTLESIDDSSCPDLENFFAHIISQRLQPLLRRGLDRAYVTHEELTSQPRGRLDFSASAKRQTWLQGRMHCSYDDLSRDVPHNRIIKSTLLLLYRKVKLTKALKKILHEQLAYFEEVKTVRVTPRSFQRIQLHRNNRAYQFILHICELVHGSLLPEHDANGKRKFRRIEENEKVMPYLFENFVLAFAKRHQPLAKSHRPTFKWLAEYHSENSENLMPSMMTDLAMEWKDSGRKLILDCKYYKEAFSKRTYNDDREVEKFKTNNLYQVFSYLMNKREDAGWGNVEGMLLYPTTTDDFHHDITLVSRHRFQACSINLNQDWKNIEADLTHILTNQRELSSV